MAHFAWWAHRQGLDGSLAGATAAEVLARAGWARSVGGSAPYLALFSRSGIRRADADAALARMEIQELPCARGCTYVMAAQDYGLGLAVGQRFAGDEMKVARKLGVTDAEITRLREAVAIALESASLGTDEIKIKVGPATRSLGPDGVKKGIATTLPLALGRMQADGEIRRVPVNGRIDQQKYRYALWQPNPLSKWKKSADESFVDLGRKYFEWFGPAKISEFQEFAGLGVKAAKAAVDPLKLIPVSDERMLLPELEDAFRNFTAPPKPQYALVGNIDGIAIASRARDKDFAESNWIVDRGQLIGRWEFDPASNSIVAVSFIPRDKALDSAIRRMQDFIVEDLGDARGFSLDSPKRREPRIAALRKAAA